MSLFARDTWEQEPISADRNGDPVPIGAVPGADVQVGVPRQIVFFSGFRQSGVAWNGVQQMFLRTLRTAGSRECYVSLYPWNADVRALARQIAHMGTLEVMVVGYSWGAGRAALQLVQRLYSENVKTARLVLIDPVKYSVWFLPLALVRWTRRLFPLKLPLGSRLVAVFRQVQNRPMGFPLRVVDPHTRVKCDQVVGARHEQMDDAPVVHAYVAEWSREFAARRGDG